MAFAVTPTSGSAPYTLSADIDNSEYIDGVNYVASVRTSMDAGSCPSMGTTQAISSEHVALLIANGSIGYTLSVPAGSCRTFTLQILRISDNAVMDTSSVSVDNVE